MELSNSVNVTRCCDENHGWNRELATCITSDSTTSQSHFTPKIYSIEAEAFVNEEIKIVATGIPSCSTSEKLQSITVNAENDESFVIISDDNSLFISSDASTYKDYCINNGDGEKAVVALYCVEDLRKVCKTRNKVIINFQ